MAIEPLFVATTPELLQKVRMSCAVEGDGDVTHVLNEAIQKVRVGFFDRLGEERVNQLVAIPFVENATTEAEIDRTKANSAEVLWVRKYLILDLPYRAFDQEEKERDNWNKEPLTRDLSKQEIELLLEKTCDELDRVLDDLDTNTDQDVVNISVFGDGVDAHCPAKPFGSIF